MGYVWTPYAVPNPKTHLNYNSIKYRIQNRNKNTPNISINFKIKTEFRHWQPYMNQDKKTKLNPKKTKLKIPTYKTVRI